jgi:hypothetical protein
MAQSSASNPHVTYTPVEVANHEIKDTRDQRPILGWKWELVSVIVSLCCMIAVVIILAEMQDQPLSHWTFHASLNATVAFFVTISKVAAM